MGSYLIMHVFLGHLLCDSSWAELLDPMTLKGRRKDDDNKEHSRDTSVH